MIPVAERFSGEQGIDLIKRAETNARLIEEDLKNNPHQYDFDSVIKLNIGRPSFEPISEVRARFAKYIYTEPLGYSPLGGFPKTRKLLAKAESWLPIEVTPEKVMYTDSGCHALDNIIKLLCNPGDRVIAPDPMWAVYGTNCRNASVICDAVPYFDAEGKVLLDGLIDAVVPGKTKAIIINTPENPTGRVVGGKALAQLAEFAHTSNLTVISDEVYASLCFDQKHESISQYVPERTIIVDSFSKKGGIPGVRAGVVVADPGIIVKLEEIDRGSIGAPSTIGQYFVWALLESDQCPLPGMKERLAARRDCVVERLAALGWESVRPGGAFYVFPNVGRDAIEFANDLLQNTGVSVVAGDTFGPAGKNHIRISYGSAGRTILREAFDRIEDYLKR